MSTTVSPSIELGGKRRLPPPPKKKGAAEQEQGDDNKQISLLYTCTDFSGKSNLDGHRT